ncbi:MAG: class I SAM-dependent methyltransferase [Burkholderiales bacterium]
MMPAEIAPPTAPAPPRQDAGSRETFFAALQNSLSAETFVKLVLAKYVGAEPGLQQVAVRPVTLRGAAHWSLTYRYQTKDVTKNLAPAQALVTLADLLGASFRNAHLLTTTHTIEFATSKRGEVTLRHKAARRDAASSREHNRAKRRFVELERPFLAALGVTDGQGRLIPAMSRKWKQIDKFIEVFSNALASSVLAGARTIRVMDFGAGKGYLTFAIHDYLRHALGVAAHVTGVDLRPDMVQLCNDAARRLGVEGLDFQQGDVTRHAPEAIDVMIALHACDTATDHAIHTGIAAGAAIIVCAPCCHKELRPQLLSPQPLRAILKHGVHLGQEAEMVTDGLRALLLEASGYATQVFEFVALEHTSKNKMILAVKRATVGTPAGTARSFLDQVAELKQFYGIREQTLERLLTARLGKL